MIDRIDDIFDTNLGFTLQVIAPGVAVDAEKSEKILSFYLYNPNLGVEHCFTNGTGKCTGNLEHSGGDKVDNIGYIYIPPDDSLLRVVSDGLAVDLAECGGEGELPFYSYDFKKGIRHAWENGLGAWKDTLETWFIEPSSVCDEIGLGLPTKEGDKKGLLEVAVPGIARYLSSENDMSYYVYDPYLGLEHCYDNHLGCWFESVELPTLDG